MYATINNLYNLILRLIPIQTFYLFFNLSIINVET